MLPERDSASHGATKPHCDTPPSGLSGDIKDGRLKDMGKCQTQPGQRNKYFHRSTNCFVSIIRASKKKKNDMSPSPRNTLQN